MKYTSYFYQCLNWVTSFSIILKTQKQMFLFGNFCKQFLNLSRDGEMSSLSIPPLHCQMTTRWLLTHLRKGPSSPVLCHVLSLLNFPPWWVLLFLGFTIVCLLLAQSLCTSWQFSLGLNLFLLNSLSTFRYTGPGNRNKQERLVPYK